MQYGQKKKKRCNPHFHTGLLNMENTQKRHQMGLTADTEEKISELDM